MSPPPTSILSWQQQVVEADPTWARARQQPRIYDFSNGRQFYAPIPLYGTPADPGLFSDGGVLTLIDPVGWPTSPTGLSPGAVWNDNLAIQIVPGGLALPPNQQTFPGVTASQLLLLGTRGLLTTPPIDGSNLLWSNGGLLCVAVS